MDPLIWPVLIILLALALIFLEMLIPSGGVLSFLALVAVIAAIVVAFVNGGLAYGTVFLAISAVALPAIIAMAVRWWPNTPMGRMIVSRPPQSDEEVLPNDEESLRLKSLLGKHGSARTIMLPAGAIMIDGQTYDAVSEGMPIEAGQTIRVVEVSANRIVVRPSDGKPDQLVDRETPDKSDGDILSRPIESLGLDPLDDPLA